MNKITVKLVEEKINIQSLYDEFYNELNDSTGTILIHHGKAKYPGKHKKDYSKIRLFIKDEQAYEKIYEFTEHTFQEYNLNKIFVYHQIGTIDKNDTILFLAVEAKDRDSAFNAVRKILEFIKAETLIGLEEI
ncbi:molybdenum cofactor biosynthesis protein MoaE [Deferribacter autotrophicus]|uniref:Molybdopterin synthase catalytic subunit n=1 Tax=Deferribacter autotrophicus TaxID=500465 RepID=A0A5A8F1P6_9BACT|nr:molybdenum cofactor biosynthesis protein MoaE [Deferribacter autotrophicus]KAA0257347.1 molybdenum cofactor biosynthesis protein MoaE [Deferribacter autotrophicus]